MGRIRQEERNEEVKGSILKIALEIGIQEGFEEISIRKITNRLGYSPGIVYHYFKDKQEILDAIHREACMDIKLRISKVYNPKESFEYNFSNTFKEIFHMAIESPKMYNLIVVDKFSQRKEEYDTWVNLLAETLRRGNEKGEISVENPELTAFNIWSSFIGMNLMVCNYIDDISFDKEDIIDNQIKIMLEGIRGCQ